jgi:predicted nuclease of predicted toxin-antitoxin system
LKFLIDNALPPALATLLCQAGYDAVHVRAYSMQAASDETILNRAVDERRIIVSADTHFGSLLAGPHLALASFVLFREPSLVTAGDYARVLIPALVNLQESLRAGCIAVFRNGRLRVRKLPLST